MNRPDLTGAEWHRASDSSTAGSFVEVAYLDGAIALRDGDNPDGPALIFTPAEWDAFVGGAKDGEFDLS